MAGETRRQRRDARRAAGQQASPRVGAPRPVPAGPEAPPAAPEHVRRGGFIRESAAELRKVEWPNQRQVLTGTVVVIIACAIVGTYLWLADLVLQPFVQRLLLGG